jgi:hypothetical protein
MPYYQDLYSYTLYYIQSLDFHGFQNILILRLITLNFYVSYKEFLKHTFVIAEGKFCYLEFQMS